MFRFRYPKDFIVPDIARMLPLKALLQCYDKSNILFLIFDRLIIKDNIFDSRSLRNKLKQHNGASFKASSSKYFVQICSQPKEFSKRGFNFQLLAESEEKIVK
jgi:hypothetical protein